MARSKKKLILVTGIIFIATQLMCFDAERTNPFDPANPNNSPGNNTNNSLNVSPTQLNFGDVQAGQSSPVQAVTINNNGNADVYIDRIESNNQQFMLSNLPIPGQTNKIQPGGNIFFNVSFAPSAAGLASASITIYSNDPYKQGLLAITVSGNGVSEPAAANYNIYVRSTNGNDLNDGTLNFPVATLTKAIEKSNSNPNGGAGDKIAVAAGTYTLTTDLVLAGKELYGGFQDDGSFNNRDPKVYVSEIKDGRISGGSAIDNPNSAVKIQGATLNPTVIDGFKIVAGTTGYTCAVRIDTDAVIGYTAIVRNNQIIGSTGNNSDYTYGIFYSDFTANGASATTITIEQNSIDGGNVGPVGIVYTYGCYFKVTSADTCIINLWNNVINSGIANSTAGPVYTTGIYCYKVSPYIFNNTIILGLPTVTTGSRYLYGIYLSTDTLIINPKIVNNIIYGNSLTSDFEYGIYESIANTDPGRVDNNDVVNMGKALYYDFNLTNLTEVNNGNFTGPGNTSPLAPAGSGNLSVNPSFDLSWRLQPSSMVKDAGFDLSTLNPVPFTTDKDGTTRNPPWSMGAYEQNN